MMTNLSHAYLSSQTVAEAVLAHLWQQRDAHNFEFLSATGSSLLLEKLWSTIYFLTAIDSGERRELVAKIAHFPDQQTPEVSWQSEELLLRGQREFETLTRVFAHFAEQPEPMLMALHPRAYLPQINAVVMDFVSGTALYDACLTLRPLLSASGRSRVEQVLHRVGQWLRWFHRLPLENVPQERVFSPPDSLAALLKAVDMLAPFGVDPTSWPKWSQTMSILSQVNHSRQVWAHGDFHLRNVLVVAPNDAVLGLDTALERVDSPYLDLGKFVADIKTRRAMIMRGGLLPPPSVIQTLTDAFLSGYLAGEPLAVLPLALYEGRFIFEKWVESLAVIQNTFGKKPIPGGATIASMMVNLTFKRLVNRWMATIDNAAAGLPGEINENKKLVTA